MTTSDDIRLQFDMNYPSSKVSLVTKVHLPSQINKRALRAYVFGATIGLPTLQNDIHVWVEHKIVA